MIGYVAGFLMDRNGRVVLVRKNKPDWQVGKLNGVGGKIEDHEPKDVAMRREFLEEAGLEIDTWELFAEVIGDWGFVSFFRAFADETVLDRVRTMEEEPIEIHFIGDLHREQALPNLAWLIPLAWYRHDLYHPIIAWEQTPAEVGVTLP